MLNNLLLIDAFKSSAEQHAQNTVVIDGAKFAVGLL